MLACAENKLASGLDNRYLSMMANVDTRSLVGSWAIIQTVSSVSIWHMSAIDRSWPSRSLLNMFDLTENYIMLVNGLENLRIQKKIMLNS